MGKPEKISLKNRVDKRECFDMIMNKTGRGL